MPRIALALPLAVALAMAPLAASDAQTLSSDPAARGLDVFVEVPAEAAPRAEIPILVEAFGFPTASTLVPLGQATIEAGWDPSLLGPGVTEAPPAVRATTDAAGRARILVPVPDGDERALQLIVGVRSGNHERTRLVKVQRGPLHTVSVYVADAQVVPGSDISAWVVVAGASSGQAAASTPVELSLVEGGASRQTQKLVTDAAGTAMARVSIPLNDEPGWSWQLRARSLSGTPARVTGQAEVDLRPREETPATPRMSAHFADDGVLAGEHAAFTVGVRDASDQPVAALPVRYWVGPRGTEPPRDDEAWLRLARTATTDAEGAFQGTADAPSLVVHGVGTTVRLVARATVDGHALEAQASVSVNVPASTATLYPEAVAVVPGVEQRLFLRVQDGHSRPVQATFAVEGDGLHASVTTDADGEAETTWRPPVTVGALRNVGPCAGGVAAAVTVRPVGVVPALRPRTEPFELCLGVDRDAHALVAVDRPVARMGERVHVRVIEAAAEGKGREAGPSPYAVVLRSSDKAQAVSAWMEDGAAGTDVELPDGTPGLWSISVAQPSPARAARVAAGVVLVLPRVLPRLAARVAGGRAAPGGEVEVDADLTDGKGQGLTGTVAALVVDLNGGGSVEGIQRIDARRSLCDRMLVDAARCDRLLDGDPTLDRLRRSLLAGHAAALLEPASDPGGTARATFDRTFGEVMHSLEGAVYEASASPDRLVDVRRRDARGSGFNPELMTLVTAALSKPPQTPGGEAVTLADLLLADPQVTYDNVAHRVARLKLFYLLQQVRTFKRERSLEADEPIFKDPNALLRRMVHDGKLTADQLLDPWGGTFQFVPAQGPVLPFLTVVRGFELRGPGPDGRAGTGDDVRDPFERVLRSGTPYARAVGEDRLVDARYDMEVGESTVSGWQTLLEEVTGKALGDGSLQGGSGQGFGSGHGRLGPSHHLGVSARTSEGLTTGVAWWSTPQRTDARGHVRFHVPLGDAETTWRVALVGVPDAAPRASTWVDVPVSLPLSARVDAGVGWIEGDAVDVAVTLRNRTSKPVRATVTAAASGAARLAGGEPPRGEVDVPAGGAVVTRVPVVAPEPGAAELVVTVSAPGLPDDIIHHGWRVLPAGEPTDLTRSQWVSGRATVDAALGDQRLADVPGGGPAAVRLTGTPRLVLERGLDRPLAAALESMDPDRLGSPAALADAVEVAVRIGRRATTRDGNGSALAARALEIVGRARARISVYGVKGATPAWVLQGRLRTWIPPEPGQRDPATTCPPSVVREALDSEPLPDGGSAMACWDALVASVVDGVTTGGDPVALAQAFLALVERPHRVALATTLLERLREKVSLRPSGAITLPEAQAHERSARAIVFAALLRGVHSDKPGPAPADRLAAWIGVQRDADGGYGSALATREVVRALLDASLDEQATSHVTVTLGARHDELEVGPSARVEIPLDAATVSVGLAVQGPGLVARLERPVLRLWSRPPPSPESPLHLDVTWPSGLRAGTKGTVSVTVRHTRGRATTVDVRVPLPPGASLAEPVTGVRQLQGALAIRRSLDASGLPVQIDVPVHFELAERVTVPEARVGVAYEEVPRALSPARPLVVLGGLR